MAKTMALPEYERPPVIEVVLGVQFEPLEALRASQMVLFWAQFKDKFPKVEEYPEIQSVMETFGPPEDLPRFKVERMAAPPVPRMWFLNEAGTELVQLKQDRLLRNWRKLGSGEGYPRYEYIRDGFLSSFRLLGEFVKQGRLGDLAINQCEITYVNHITLPGGDDPHSGLHRILTGFSGETGSDFLGKHEYEDAQLLLRYVIPGQGGSSEPPLGRFIVSAEPRWKLPEKEAVIRLALTVRGQPTSSEENAILDFLNIGHDWLVEGFTSITTSEMHRFWRKKP